MATEGVYILVSNWKWGNSNLEYATITQEASNEPLDSILDSNYPSGWKSFIVQKLKGIAEAQSGNSADGSKPVALFKIDNPGGNLWLKTTKISGINRIVLEALMKPICGFDKDGNPVPIEQSAIKIFC
jgi:hypothetical protein